MKIFCILGDERAYLSKSPVMFQAILKQTGIRGAYVPFKVAPKDIGRAVMGLRTLNITGANVTVPYKEAVIPHLDILSEGANIIGAINTIVRMDDNLKGYNTNAIGVMDALSKAQFEIPGKTVLLLGTGGAGKTVAFILNWLRAKKIFIAGRSMEKLNAVVDRFGGEPVLIDDLESQTLPIDLVVNATSVSSPEESTALSALIGTLNLPECRLILDLNYGRRENFWQRKALDNNIHFMDGLSPLAFQARRTFALWTGLTIRAEDFLAALSRNPF
jgi:shikimate dehydrogenase